MLFHNIFFIKKFLLFIIIYLKGGTGTVIAYGPTGSGKRFSIEGTPQHPGLLPFSILAIFTCIIINKIRYYKLQNDQQ